MPTEATEMARITIFFNDGTKLDIAAPPKAEDPLTRMANIRRAMEIDNLMVEVDGQLLMVPLSNVKYIQMSPAPPKLPDGVLTGGILMT